MHFPTLTTTTTTLLALLSTTFTLTTAQENPFNVPDGGYSSIAAGGTVPLSWKPTTGGKVTLVLRSGDSKNLAEGTLIASDVDNSGSYEWKVPGGITKGAAYTIQIVAGGDLNYTPYFPIDSPNTAPSQTSIIPTGAPSGATPPPLPARVREQQESITSGQPQPTSTSEDMSESGTEESGAEESGAEETGEGNAASRRAVGGLVVAVAGVAMLL